MMTSSENKTSPKSNIKKPKKIALVLSGCGHKDGSEITEAVSLLVALTQTGAQVDGFAPAVLVAEIDHVTGNPQVEKRNALVESARILRGRVQDLKLLKVSDYDALCFAGGFGAVTVLSNWGEKGARCEVLPEVRNAILGFYNDSKPIGAVCIAPVLLARTLGDKRVTLTVGAASDAAREITKTGCIHEVCPVDDFITDRDHKVITSPAYMYDASPAEVFKGISGLAKELLEMA